MSWFPGQNVMQRCYVYLFQRYFGEYFEEKLDTDQISFQLFKGLAILRDVRLDVQKLNETAESMNLPFEFVDGSIDEFKLKVPLRTILTESSTIDITGLRVTLQPKQRKVSDDLSAPSMFESMWSSMTSSIHLAADALGSQGIGNAPGNTQSYEGLVTFAETIDSILSRVKVNIADAVILVEYLPRGSTTGVGLVFNIDLISYTNESSNDPPKEEDLTKQEEKKAYTEQSFTITNTCLQGITVSTVEFSTKGRNITPSAMSDSSCFDKDDAFSSIIDKSNLNDSDETRTSSDTSQDPYYLDEERSVIKCGEFNGKIEVIARMKRSEEIEGPKVAIHVDTGGLFFFLSPRQVHLLTEFAKGLANPDPEDLSNTHATKYAGKPMSAEDYERIEKDLQQQMTNPAPNFQLGFGGGHGWATGTLDGSDIDENFVPAGRFSSGLYESAMSGASTMESSFTSSITSSCTEATSRTRKKMNKIDTDPTAKISKFEIHMASLGIVLLHEDLLTESLEANTRLVPSSVCQMQTICQKFFEKSAAVFQAKDCKATNAALDEACQSNHLRLLASSLHLECDQKATNSGIKFSGYLETTNLELSECLYQTNSDNVEHIPLVTFNEIKPVQFASTAKPNLKLIFKHLQKTNSGKSGPRTELLFEINKSVVELDITIADRITALLNPQPISVVSKPNLWPTNATNQLSNENESKVDLKVTCPSMTIKLRFPVPDFRQPYDRNRIPWWKRHVRPDYMNLVLSGMSFQTNLQSSATGQEYTFRCRSLNVAYHEDATSDPVPIGKAGYEDKPMSSLQDVMTECKLSIKLCPSKRQSLEEPTKVHQDPISSSIMIGLLEDRKPNGPFSSKKVVYESDTPHHKQQSDDSKELLVPGDKSEINDFVKTSTASARIRVEVSLPVVSMQLISKRLYETIYNRINNDLLLWEPSAPKPKTSTPTYDNLSCGPFGNIEIEGQEVFTLCKSGIQYDSESESDEEIEEGESVFYSTYGSRMKMSQKQVISESKENSYLTLNIHIGRGLLCMCTPVRDATTNNVIPNQQGEFLVNVEDATIFMVNGYMGDADLGYVCLELHNAQLYHCDMMSTPSHSPPLKDIGATPGKHFHPTIYGSENGMLADCKNRGGNREMLTLCVKIKASHETHHVKNVSIAAALNKATLRHRMWNPANSWISQLIDFFNVNDYPIPGYHNNEILTELYFHCYDCAIQYNPIHLPTRAAFLLGSFSISSHLSAEVNTSTLRLIFEESGMFLSQKGVKRHGVPYSGPVDIKRDYVNVIEVGLLEISLKTSDKKNIDAPHFDMRASINSLVIRTCADSARALMRLIVYYSNYGDLVPPEDTTASGSAFSSPRHTHEQELVSVEPQEVVNLSESQHQQINDLIQDALEDIDEGAPSQAKSEFYTYNGAKIFYFPDEKLPPQDPGKPLPQVTTELGQVPFEPTTIDSDDEFCFLDQEPGYNIFPKNGEPEIKWLCDEPVRIVDNHLSVPSERTDPLKTPKDFPVPVIRYTFSATINWQMYGGNDFGPPNKEKKKVIFSDEKLKDSVSFSNTHKEKVQISSEKVKKKPWMERGGPNRNHNVLMELQLSKIRFQHEVYPETSSKAARMVFLVQDIEIRDRLKASRINKFMSLYTSEARPKQSNANMLLIKALHVRPDPQLKTKECCLKISVLPLRFYIDQDALLFLISFFTELGSDGNDDDAKGSKHNTPVHQPPVMTVSDDNDEALKEEMTKMVDENLLILLEENRMEEAQADDAPQTTSTHSEDGPIYFRKVVFSPALHIVIDYEGRMSTDLKKMGSVQDIFMGFASLKFSELTLKSINHRHGLLGVDKVLTHFIKEWLSDIKKNQIPKILSGVGPMNSFVLLFQGLKDLFCLPFEQYRKDGRFFRGLHRGARSFSKSTTAALLELTDRFIAIILFAAETAFDMLTPGPSVRINPKTKGRRKRYNQPKDIREGVTNAYKLVKEGIEETADNILQVASHEHEQKGYSGAVGGVIRQIPPTIIKPIIIASEATSNVLGGVRCQLIPDARKEALEKWRNEETYDSYE